MNDFSGYEKIPRRLKRSGGRLKNATWVVTEKVHGANFSFFNRHGNLRVAKRRGILNTNDNFFSFQQLVSRMRSQMMALFGSLQAELHPTVAPEYKTFIVYGELFGGGYPHPNVEHTVDTPLVQHGVYYSPNIHFCAFDIGIF